MDKEKVITDYESTDKLLDRWKAMQRYFENEDKKGNMKVGDKLIAKWSESITDHVTKDQVYEIVRVENIGFYITNDKGKECFPISTSFRKVDITAD